MKNLTIAEVQKIETYLLKTAIDVCDKYQIQYSLYAGSVLGAIRHKGTIPWDSDVDIIISINDCEKFILAMQKETTKPIYIDYYTLNEECTILFPRVGLLGMDISRIHVDIFLYSGVTSNKDEQLHYIMQAKKIKDTFYNKCFIKSKNSNIIKRNISNLIRMIKWLTTIKSKVEIFNDFVNYSYLYNIEECDDVVELGCCRYGTREIFPKRYWTETISVDYENIKVNVPKDYEGMLVHLYGDYKKYPSIEEQEKIYTINFESNDDIYQWCIKNGLCQVFVGNFSHVFSLQYFT